MFRVADSNRLVKTGLFVGRYRYSEIIAGSKTGESLLAIDEHTGRPVVIKRPNLLQPNPDAQLAASADLAREERALRVPALDQHPAVCRLLGAGEAVEREGVYRYLVLARAVGTPLSDLKEESEAQGQLLPAQIYLPVFQQLLHLLAVAHQVGVVYNDVKLDHLFWDATAGRLQVIDWGNAQFTSESGSLTPGVDVFQCGELLYELTTGQRFQRADSRDPAPANLNGLALGVDLQKFLSKALHPNPRLRFRDAGEMAADFDLFCAVQGVSEVRPTVSLAKQPTAPTVRANFHPSCLQLQATLADPLASPDLIRSQALHIFATARTEAEWAEADYWQALADASLALWAGRPEMLAAHLAQAQKWPGRGEIFESLWWLGELLAALARGEGDALNEASRQIRARPAGPGGWGWILAEGCEQLRSGLELFKTQPEAAWPHLEQLPALLRVGWVTTLATCSHQVENALDSWRAGDFATADLLLIQTGAQIESLPAQLGVDLAAAARPIQTYLAGVRHSAQLFDELQSQVEARQNQGAELLLGPARQTLRDLTDSLPRRRDPADPPLPWLTALEDKLVQPDRVPPSELAPIRSAPAAYPRYVGAHRRRTSNSWRWPRVKQLSKPQLAVLAVIGLGLLVGPGLVWVISGQITRPVGVTSLNVVRPTATQSALAATSLPVVQPGPTIDACQQIESAERTEAWQSVVTQITLLEEPSAALSTGCNFSLAHTESLARFHLGQTAYLREDFDQALDQWTIAYRLDPAIDPALPLLLRCTTARQEAAPALFADLLQAFAADDIQAACGFDARVYLPPTEIPVQEYDLLAALAAQSTNLISPCAEPPCPTLFRDDLQKWHLGTFFEEAAGGWSVDQLLQQIAPVSAGSDRLQSLTLVFAVSNPQPYSFPYGAQLGWEFSWPDGRLARFSLVSEAPQSARVQLLGTGPNDLVCEPVGLEPLAMRDSAGNFPEQSLTATWDGQAQQLSLLVNGQKVCQDQIQAASVPRVALYFMGAGLNLEIRQFKVALFNSQE